ncbi:MAG: NUDIX domain-containing protein [Clostridiales bacterium]|nr:NUDIX domain-containing protein [Clostridiales bacterium]
MEVKFYDEVDDRLLDYAVVAARYRGKWVFCKHRERDTYECPGGRREPGEAIIETAKRELWEETGAVKYELRQLGVYSVVKDGAETFGMLYFGEIHQFGELPPLEIEKVALFDEMPDRWTYPQIQPKLIEKITASLFLSPDGPAGYRR